MNIGNNLPSPNEDDGLDKKWSVLAMFIVRDQDNLKKDFESYKTINDDRINKLITMILEKYNTNKVDISVIQVKIALIASFITFTLTTISGGIVYALKDHIAKLLGM